MAKVNYKKVNKLSLTERAYVAGIIDGEGTVTLTIKQKGGTRHLSVTVSNTELPLLEYLIGIIGVGKITNKKVYKKHHKASYTYALHNRQALCLLEQICSYLKTYKLERTKLVLEKYVSVTPRNGKYSQEMKRRKEEFASQFFSILP